MPEWWDRMAKLRRRRGGSRADAAQLETPSKQRAVATIVLAFAVLAICALYSSQGRPSSASDQAADSSLEEASTEPPSDAGAEWSVSSPDAVDSAFPWLYGYDIVRELPHQADAFTQGLEYDKRCTKTVKGDGFECVDIFWESTGMNGVSSVREVDLETGDVLRQKVLAHEDFAEGVTRLNGRLYQLVWRTGKLFSYDTSNLDDVKQLATPLQDGWGIATDGASLIVSDSGPTLYWLDGKTLKEIRRVDVHDGTRKVPWVNELEWVDGELWGNVWQTECIARIDPKTGLIRGWILLNGLSDAARRESKGRMIDVLNGIAWDAAGKRLFLTGKYWPRMYEVKLRRLTGAAASIKAVQDARSVCIPKIAAVGWR